MEELISFRTLVIFVVGFVIGVVTDMLYVWWRYGYNPADTPQ